MATSTPTKTITYMALMAALNVLFAFVATFVPMAGLFLVIALPLASALVALRVELRYYPIYFVATLGLCLVVTLQQLETTIFYVFPSLILGFAYGLLYRFKMSDGVILIVSSIVQLGLLYLTVVLIDAIFEIDFIASIQALMQLGSSGEANVVMPAFLYVISLAQTIITYMIIGPEIEKVMAATAHRPMVTPWLFLFGLVLTSTIIPLGWLLPGLSYILLGPALLIAGLALYQLIDEHRFGWVGAAGIWFLLSVFLMAILYPLLEKKLTLLLVSLTPLGLIAIKNLQLVFASFRVKS
ncbi:MAG: hypothetical protein WC399_00455 [Bacilli bacterium]|jgi:hypothetical protein